MDGFLAGLLLGIFLGLALGPLLRAWLLWRVIEDARRDATLADEILRRMDDDDPMNGPYPNDASHA